MREPFAGRSGSADKRQVDGEAPGQGSGSTASCDRDGQVVHRLSSRSSCANSWVGAQSDRRREADENCECFSRSALPWPRYAHPALRSVHLAMPLVLAAPDFRLEAGAVLLLASCSLLYTPFSSSTSR